MGQRRLQELDQAHRARALPKNGGCRLLPKRPLHEDPLAPPGVPDTRPWVLGGGQGHGAGPEQKDTRGCRRGGTCSR